MNEVVVEKEVKIGVGYEVGEVGDEIGEVGDEIAGRKKRLDFTTTTTTKHNHIHQPTIQQYILSESTHDFDWRRRQHPPLLIGC